MYSYEYLHALQAAAALSSYKTYTEPSLATERPLNARILDR